MSEDLVAHSSQSAGSDAVEKALSAAAFSLSALRKENEQRVEELKSAAEAQKSDGQEVEQCTEELKAVEALQVRLVELERERDELRSKLQTLEEEMTRIKAA